MTKLPALESKRLRIVPFIEEFLSLRYVGWLNDKNVVRYSEQRHRTHTLDTCMEYYRSFDASPHYFGAIILKGCPDEHIGNVTVLIDAPNQVADLAIMIGETKYWGQHIGSEAWSLLVTELLTKQRIRKIIAGTMAINAGMVAIMKRNGMREEARRRGQFLWEGQEVDMVLGSIFSTTSRIETMINDLIPSSSPLVRK